MLSDDTFPGTDESVVAATSNGDLPAGALTGRQLILLVEDRYNRASARTLQRNPFWRAMVERPKDIPDAVYHGMCIENYHLLCRESYFDAPVLSFPSSRRVRELINEFYVEEIGHDRILLQALRSIGLSEEELNASVPLAATMGLCNSLSYWARHDPLFFLTTLGPLEGRDVDVDSFVLAAETKGLPESFVGPIRTHAHINRDSEHGLLTREIFEELPVVSAHDACRVLELTGLFIAVYDRFYTNIWNHYSTIAPGRPLLRPAADI
jgi:hypothetical protein